MEAAELTYYTCRETDPCLRTGSCGALTVIHDVEDARQVAAHPSQRVLFVDLAHTTSRDPAKARTLAALLSDARQPTLLRGSLLSHFAALLREAGIKVYPMNSTDSLPLAGSWVEVVRCDQV